MTAPVNIAVIKYWGKRDTKLILPTNSSLSLTLDQDSLNSNTTVVASKDFEQDQFFLNGKEINISDSKRMVAVISQMRANAQACVFTTASDSKSTEEVKISSEEWSQYKLKFVSHNNFPTAAGLASSASGGAALAYALATLFHTANGPEPYPGWLSAMARQGSGSACRSVYGGFVEWIAGDKADGTDSVAVERFSNQHWPEMRCVVLVVHAGEKKVGSTAGMQNTVQSSALFPQRLEIVPQRVTDMNTAIRNRDFPAFGTLTMKDSNNFHSCCLDTFPPIVYMTDTSHHIVELVHAFNKAHGEIVACYTYDAGPNAVLYTLDSHFATLLDLCENYFPNANIDDNMNLRQAAIETRANAETVQAQASHVETIKGTHPVQQSATVNRMIVTKVGDGPRVLKRQVV